MQVGGNIALDTFVRMCVCVCTYVRILYVYVRMGKCVINHTVSSAMYQTLHFQREEVSHQVGGNIALDTFPIRQIAEESQG